MGLGFRKSIKIGPFRINMSKSAVGLSMKVGPFSQSLNSRGRGRTTVTVPGSGVFYRKQEQVHLRNNNT